MANRIAELAVRAFRWDLKEIEKRHHALFDTSDPDIFRLALDIAQTPAKQIVYLENTALFIQIAESMGIQGVLHKNGRVTRAELLRFGLEK